MKQLLFVALIGFISLACTKERLTGNGDVVSEMRNVSGFTGIHSSGSNKIHVKYGTSFKVELRGSSNLIPRFETRVRNNRLELGYDNVWNVRRNDIEIFVTMPAISDVSLSGSGKVTIEGEFQPTNSFEARISGSGNVEVRDEFECDELSINISGSGKARLADLVSKSAHVTVSGSGDVWVTAMDHLKVRISGSGDVYYRGNPVIDEKISGSGNLQRM
ncbi:MAG TPA: head GIN domain-containing protein [Sphingobacteriaceae bacterium]